MVPATSGTYIINVGYEVKNYILLRIKTPNIIGGLEAFYLDY